MSPATLPASGFFISDAGAFVTSSHVVHHPDYEGMIVLTGEGRVFPVRALLGDDERYDVAILKVEGARVASLPLANGAEAGNYVAVMSHPLGRFYTFAEGVITRHSLQHDGTRSQEIIEISAEFGPGSSGAPVVNLFGNVIGWVDGIRVQPSITTQDGVIGPSITFRECGVSGDLLRLVQRISSSMSPGMALPDVTLESSKPINSTRP